ncbi:tetratricopeptide repeat protein (macronuclear) [Tetrahymena thermophila SB210]|uniref:Tetratricopeptide repeat protein n=1 Tax=Tetrahymena thermophila (strain SB210) TaxID=312017 RepID=Q22CW7_TETTS|nr:tetratricopeptide repeat protein [Tetrahymena thermophila SB210]EAR83152.2 tetratricopeptide repeat protein [Tetrahymena thermophila SB210]|eukprot:XP_001030815.2 tetratricopeptide repeat protein [Tetrahymena thermophila SB210]
MNERHYLNYLSDFKIINIFFICLIYQDIIFIQNCYLFLHKKYRILLDPKVQQQAQNLIIFYFYLNQIPNVTKVYHSELNISLTKKQQSIYQFKNIKLIKLLNKISLDKMQVQDFSENNLQRVFKKLIQEGKFQEALILCESYISNKKCIYYSYLLIVQLYFENLSEPLKAKETLLKMIEHDQNQEEAYGLLGYYYRNFEKDYQKAEEYYLKSVEVNPTYVKGLNNLGFFYNNVKQDYEKASIYYDRVLKIDKEGQGEVMSLAIKNILMFYNNKVKDSKKCEAICDQLFEKHKKEMDEELIEFVKATYKNKNKLSKLEKVIEYQIELNPDDKSLKDELEETQTINQKLHLIEKKMIEMLEKDNKNEQILKTLIDFYRDQMVDDEKAQKIYELALQKYPESAYYLNDYATFTIINFKDYDKAESLLKRVQPSDPQFKASRQNLITLYSAITKNYDKLEQYLLRLIEIDDVDNQQNYEDLIGYYRNIRNEKKAKEVYISYKKKFLPEAFEQQLKCNQELMDILETRNTSDHLENLVKCLTITGQFTEIEKSYEKYLKKNQNDVQQWIKYAQFLTNEIESLDKAENAYKEALQFNSNDQHLAQQIYEFYFCDMQNEEKIEKFLIDYIEKNKNDQNQIQNAFAFFLKQGKKDLSQKYHELFYKNRKDNKDIKMVYPARYFFNHKKK